jgi:uncharacterized membrane protein
MQHRLTWEERIESIKAGGVAAASVALVFPMTILANDLVATRFAEVPMNYWVSGAIALFAGFLFGITYRYVIRQDDNSHLKSGAVLAFGLVRGLAQVDIGISIHSTIVPVVVLAVESILLFANARLILDWAMTQGWIQRFKG